MSAAGQGPSEARVARPPEARPRRVAGPLHVFGTGLAMGAADLVPGFSGGTVALVAGLYQRLVANVRQATHGLALVLRGQLREVGPALRAVEWGFVVTLLAGIVTAIATLARFLDGLLVSQPVLTSAVFLGLVLGATVVASDELRAPHVRHLGVGVGVALVTFVGLGVTGGTIADPSLLVFALGGAIAVCAMILPGISGSFLLLLVGIYDPVLTAVSERDLAVVGVVAAGCVVGLASFSTLLHWALRHHHDLVLAALLGLMVGSARVLWPWPSTEGVGDPTLGAPSGQVWGPVLAVLIAFALVVGLGRLARRFVDEP